MALTPLQQKLFNVLTDGQPHSYEELLACIDELADDSAYLTVVFSHIRLELPKDLYIHCDKRTKTYRLLRPAFPLSETNSTSPEGLELSPGT